MGITKQKFPIDNSKLAFYGNCDKIGLLGNLDLIIVCRGLKLIECNINFFILRQEHLFFLFTLIMNI